MFQNLETAHIREAEVEQHCVRPGAIEHRNGIGSRPDAADRVGREMLASQADETLANYGRIFRDEELKTWDRKHTAISALSVARIDRQKLRRL